MHQTISVSTKPNSVPALIITEKVVVINMFSSVNNCNILRNNDHLVWELVEGASESILLFTQVIIFLDLLLGLSYKQLREKYSLSYNTASDRHWERFMFGERKVSSF